MYKDQALYVTEQMWYEYKEEQDPAKSFFLVELAHGIADWHVNCWLQLQ